MLNRPKDWDSLCTQFLVPLFYLYAGIGYDWAGQSRAKELSALARNMPALSLISTLGATEPTGSAKDIYW